MPYEFKWDSDRCWYKTVCSKFGTEECDSQCIRFSEMDYLMYLSNIPKARQMPYTISPQNCDVDNFIYLKSIKDNITDFVNSGENLYIYSKNCGNGKAQPLSSEILTEKGYKKLEDIKLGDKVFGDDGYTHEIMGIFPQGECDVYKVSFSDNTETYCTKDHLWTVHSNSKGRHTYTTEHLMNNLNISTDLDKNIYRYRIPICYPITFDEKYVRLNPYIYGLVIGNYIKNNSSVKNSYLVINNTEIINRVEAICEIDNRYKLECINKKKGIYDITFNNNSINFDCNHIEDLNRYIYNTIDIRYELLNGIIDICGLFRLNTHIIRVIVKEDLVNYIRQIVELLGGTASTEKYDGTIRDSIHNKKIKKKLDNYIVYIDLPLEDRTKFCTLSIYKNIASKLFYNSSRPKRYITDITFSHREECVCIKVRNSNHLYLTNNCIVTHNTSWSIKMLQEYFNRVWLGNRYRCRGLFIFVPSFLNDIKKNINNPSAEFNDFVNRIKIADLVVWDDIGANKLSEFDHTQLLSYVDQRNLDLKSNIYTGNLDYEQLLEAIGNRLASRIWNNSIQVEILGTDRRGIDGSTATP